MEREGKTLKKLPANDRRRVSDARNALRKASPQQRQEIMRWFCDEIEIGRSDLGLMTIGDLIERAGRDFS